MNPESATTTTYSNGRLPATGALSALCGRRFARYVAASDHNRINALPALSGCDFACYVADGYSAGVGRLAPLGSSGRSGYGFLTGCSDRLIALCSCRGSRYGFFTTSDNRLTALCSCCGSRYGFFTTGDNRLTALSGGCSPGDSRCTQSAGGYRLTALRSCCGS